ncbi:MAG: acyltransferase family protein [Nevskiales bacterium]
MQPAPRRHDIDALRVLAFSLLILYHCAMAYVADWDWHIKSTHTAEWLQYPMLFLNRWRMELLFLISGLALSFLRRRAGGIGLAWMRTRRLLLPLLFGMAVVVPLQPYIQGVGNGLVEPGFWRFLPRYWSGGPWPPQAFDGWQFGVTWNHLWYLAYVWVYTMLLLALSPLLQSRPGRAVQAAIGRLRGPGLLFLPALPLIVWSLLWQARFAETHDLIHDWFMHAEYFSFFLYGHWLGSDTGLWDELRRLRRRSLGFALLIFCAYLPLLRLLPDDASLIQLSVTRALRWTYCWLALAAVLGWAHHLLNRPFRWLPYATEAVFPWYVLHQTLIVGLAYLLIPLHLGAVLEPALLLGGTVLGCALLHEGLIRRTPWLRPLFGLDRRSRRNTTAAPVSSRETARLRQTEDPA